MAYHQCGFFQDIFKTSNLVQFIATLWAVEMFFTSVGYFSRRLLLSICRYNSNNLTVYHCCGLFYVSSKSLMLSFSSHTGSNWMVYHPCGLFYVSSNVLMLSISTHTGSNYLSLLWALSCLFKWLDLEPLWLHFGAAEGFLPGVGSFVALQIA